MSRLGADIKHESFVTLWAHGHAELGGVRADDAELCHVPPLYIPILFCYSP